MRRRLFASVLTALTVAAIASPVGASGVVDLDRAEGGIPAYVCVDSRLLPRGYCVYYVPPGE